MSSTENNAATETVTELSSRLSGELFDRVLCPLAAARRAEGAAPYFPTWRDDTVASYFGAPDMRKMTADSFGYPGGGTADRLVDALTHQWAQEGEAVLASTGSELHAIVDALRDEAASQDPTVDIFCYTLF